MTVILITVGVCWVLGSLGALFAYMAGHSFGYRVGYEMGYDDARENHDPTQQSN